MAEPPANWDQQDDDASGLAAAANKLGRLNVNAMEFVPTFGSGFSMAPKPAAAAPQPVVPKTPPSTPIISQHITIEEKQQQPTEPIIKPIEVNLPPPVPTAVDADFDDVSKDEIESEFLSLDGYMRTARRVKDPWTIQQQRAKCKCPVPGQFRKRKRTSSSNGISCGRRNRSILSSADMSMPANQPSAGN